MADVVFAVADDLNGGDRAVAIVDGDLEAMLGEQPFLHGEIDGGVRGPGRPIEPQLELVGGESGSAGQQGHRHDDGEGDEGAQSAEKHRSAPVHGGLIKQAKRKSNMACRVRKE